MRSLFWCIRAFFSLNMTLHLSKLIKAFKFYYWKRIKKTFNVFFIIFLMLSSISKSPQLQSPPFRCTASHLTCTSLKKKKKKGGARYWKCWCKLLRLYLSKCCPYKCEPDHWGRSFVPNAACPWAMVLVAKQYSMPTGSHKLHP